MTSRIKKGRITIQHEEDGVKIWWQRLHWLHILVMVALPMSVMTVMAGEFGLKEVMDNPTIDLTTEGHIIFWPIWVCLFYLVIFNRKSLLMVNKDKIVLKRGLFPSRIQSVEMSKVIEITIKKKKESYINADDTPGPSRGPFYRVLITRVGGNPIRTDDFIKEEAESICEEIKKRR